MLLPAEMRPFLLHEDPNVRFFATQYFGDAHDPAPLTTDDLWAAADRMQGEARWIFTRQLPSFPSTSASTARLYYALRVETDDTVFHHLCAALMRHRGSAVRAALDDRRIARRLPDVTRAELDVVVDLAERSFEDLWTLGETCDIEVKEGMFLLKPSLFWMNRVADALARFPDQAAARALDTLLDGPQARGAHRARWPQAFAAKVLRGVRHPGTLVPLLAMARDPRPFHWASDWAEDALVYLGTREVVAASAAGFPSGGWFDQIAGHILGRIKRPESEQALVRLLAVTSDAASCTRLGMALCELCTTSPEALDRLEALVSCRHFDPDRGSLDEALLTVCAVLGFQPVDAPAWRERVELRKAAWRSRDEQ